jgi:uncharacterized membrane protein YkoI
MKMPYLLEILAGTAIALHAIAASSSEGEIPYTQFVQAAQPNITIGQAIVIAEKEVGGEAIEAELEKEDGKFVYDVDVQTPTGTMEVSIDPKTGTVLSIEPED